MDARFIRADLVRYATWTAATGAVRQFVTKYNDRIIYATDFTLGQEEACGAASLISTHEREWNFFAGTAEGSLALPEAVLKKIFHDDAARWIPETTAG